MRLVSRNTGYNALARIRVSHGLRVRSYHGALNERISSDIDFGVIHADSAFSVAFEHAHRGTLDERENAFVQCAVLYTSMNGQRRVRVLNLVLEVAALAGSVFKFADVDATVCHLAKEGELHH
jgi:protein transport protein SEC24